MKRASMFSLLALIFVASAALADDPQSATSQVQNPVPAKPNAPVSERKTSIKFENEVVEGMNRNPLDSVEQISQQDSDGQHLYRKRKSFKDQTPSLVREMGYGL